MYQMIINKEYNIVENIVQYHLHGMDNISSMINFKMSSMSIIPGCSTYSIKMDKIPDEVMVNPPAYIYIDGTFYKRPFIIIDILDKQNVLKKVNNNYYLPLEQNITFRVYYLDPDNFNYREKFNYVKLKDRYGFLLNIPNKLELNSDGYSEFSTKTRFPGVCKLRAKDDKYLCLFYPLEIEFKDGV